MNQTMLTVMLLRIGASPTPAFADTSMEEQFRNPPQAAEPQVWWHWMNGNVDTNGTAADIDWMADQDIGGLHLFEGGRGAPKQISTLKSWMSPKYICQMPLFDPPVLKALSVS